MDISEVSRASGLTPATLRYYESLGLIATSGRQGIRRQYHSSVLEQLALINLGSLSGFSLNEIKDLLPKGNRPLNRELLRQKALELDSQIKRLSAIRDGLQHASDCPHERHFDCPKFTRLLKRFGRKAKL